MTIKIAVAGKGGSGKTSITALVIRYLKKNGKIPILAVDADPNANLGESLRTTGRANDRHDTGWFSARKNQHSAGNDQRSLP